MVHKDKVLEIYNSQNEDQVSIRDVEKILSNPSEELKDSFALTHKDYFVMEAIIENDEFELMQRKKADKPYYIPKRDELLKYVDDGYFEKSKQCSDLLAYLKKNFFKAGDEKAEWLAMTSKEMELSNNIRIWENNGHAPHEIFEKFEKPNLRPLPDKLFDFNATNVIDMKTRKKASGHFLPKTSKISAIGTLYVPMETII